MHHPVSLDALGGPAPIEDERFLEADALGSVRRVNGPIRAGRLPEAGAGHSIGSRAIPVLSVPRAVEVPLLLACGRHLCRRQITFCIFFVN